jgi:hypothetical protein
LVLGRATSNLDTQDSPRPRLGGSHHLPLYSILCSSPWGPHPNNYLSQDSQVGVPKFSQLWLPRLWRCITSCENLWLWCGLMKSCSLCQNISNDMLHAACTQGNQVDSQLLVVGSQTTNLTPDLSFGHNLCFRYTNGWCEPILDMYASITFQWYKKLFEAMSFGPCHRVLKIWKSFWDSNLGVWRFIPSHFSHSQEHLKWLPGLPLGSQPYNPLPWSRAQG